MRTKCISILSLLLLLVGCGEEHIKFELAKNSSFKEVSEVVFVLNQLGINYDLLEKEGGTTIKIDNVSANYAQYVLYRLKQRNDKLLSAEVKKDIPLSLDLMEGVISYSSNKIGSTAVFNVVVEYMTDKSALEAKIIKMLAHNGFDNISVSFQEFDLLRDIQRFSYEFHSTSSGGGEQID